MSVRVVTRGGEAVEREADGGAWLVDEREEYRIVAPGADHLSFGGASLARDAAGFVLTLSFWTGHAQVIAHRGESCETISLVVRPPAHKLEPGEWETLLDEIDRRWPGCTLGVEGGLHGQVGDEGLERLLALLAFEPLLDEFVRDLAALLEALRTRELFPERYVPLRSVRRLDASTARWVATHSSSAAVVSPSAHRAAAYDVVVPHRRREVSWDHPANRTIRWLLERLAARLDSVAQQLRMRAERLHDSLTDARTWCVERALRLERAAERIDLLMRRSALSQIASAPPDASAFLTLANDPRYARVYRRCRRWLAPRVDRSEGADVPIRASFELYERWCLLAVREALAEVFPDAHWRDVSTTATDAFARTTGGEAAVGQCDAGTVTLYDNLRFAAWSGEDGGPFSITTERYPDFVVAWEGRDGARAWVLLDAKYRASRASIAAALEEIHVYRDALRWPDRSGACRGAIVLVPSAVEAARRWGEPAFLERFRFGYVIARPSGDVKALSTWLRRWLLEEGPDSSYP